METVTVENLVDFDPPSETPKTDGDQHSTDSPTTTRESLPEPMAPTDPHHEQGSNSSDSTESADSEDDPEPDWDLRRSSSSSAQSGEDGDSETAERRRFMKNYVEKVFNGKDDLDQEEKSLFGEMCSGDNGKGREWFSRYVSAQRCHSKCVSEATFYRLVQSFAVVLFECYQMDDYSPAKNLMTMCFTYYYCGRSPPSPSELLDRPSGPSGPSGPDSYVTKANSWLSVKRDAAERLLKTTSRTRTEVRGFLGGLESKLRSSITPKTPDEDETKPKSPVSEAPEEKNREKVYLYTHLKQQPIWHTLRFWNAAFFDAVHCERKKRSPPTRDRWSHMTQEERDDSEKMDENITFGQLGTFTHNMLAFGLSKKLCSDFLKKQAVIGNLDQEQYKLLSDHIENMAAQ